MFLAVGWEEELCEKNTIPVYVFQLWSNGDE